MSHNAQRERDARAYCRSIGLNPDDMVLGVDDHRFGSKLPSVLPRWQWYLGVSEAALRKAI